MVDEPHNVSGVPRSRVCGSCDHYFALPVVPYRLLHPFTGQGPEGQATCATCGAGRPQQEGWLLEIQKGVLCVLRVLSVPFSVASGSAFGCVLCVLRVLGALRASSGIASGVASMCLACSACSTDSARPLWTWIQDEGTRESSDEEESEEESEEEPEEAKEAEEEEDEEGSDPLSVKGEDEPSLAQRAPRSTHLEVARGAAQPKGTPVKAKREAKSEARPEPEELSKKKKEKTKSPPKRKSKGKQKVEEKPKHVRYAAEGEPHRTMPTGATRGEKYQAGAAYDNDVQVM